MCFSGISRAGSAGAAAHEREGPWAVAPQPGDYHLRAGRTHRPAERLRHRGRTRHLGQRVGSGIDRRAAPLRQADVHDGCSQSATLRAAAGAGELAGQAARHWRVAVSRVVRSAGVWRRPRRRHSFKLALAAHGSAHRPHQRPLRKAPGRRHPVRPCLLEGSCRRHRLVPVRPRAGRSVPPAATARRARHERRPGRADRAM